MAILRNKMRNSFTVVNNKLLNNKVLNMKERGLLITLLSLPDSWEFSLHGICALFPDGTDAVRSGLKSLQNKGYIKQYRERDGKGHLTETVWEVYEEPQNIENTDDSDDDEGSSDSEKMSDFPIVGNPKLDTPKLDNPKLGKPILEEPILVKPKQEEPILENQTQLNINNNKRLTESSINDNQGLNKSIINSINHSVDPDEYIWEEYTPEVKQELIERLKNNIGFEYRKKKERPEDFDLFYALTKVVIDFINAEYKGFYVNIGGKQRPYNEVINAFMNLEFNHINCARNKIRYVGMDKITDFNAYALEVIFRLALLPASACMEKKKGDSWNLEMKQDYDFDEMERLMRKGWN